MLNKRPSRVNLRAACLASLVVVGFVGAGCGDDASSSPSDGEFQAAATGVQECLTRVGAREAMDAT